MSEHIQPIITSACAKAILVGEHAVLYGQSALAVALPQVSLRLYWGAQTPPPFFTTPVAPGGPLWLGVSTAFEVAGLGDFLMAHPQALHLQSDIPMSAGLGSSAAFSVALTKLCDALRARLGWASLPQNRFLSRANEVDSQFHGKASGVDVATVWSQGIIHFTPGQSPQVLPPPSRGCTLVVVDTGQPSATKTMVAKVAQQLRETPSLIRHINDLGQLSRSVLGELRGACQWERVGQFCAQAHGHLKALGVTTEKQDKMVETLSHVGAWGAKMTGGGGGGAVLALFDPQCPLPLAELQKLGGVCVAHVGPQAVPGMGGLVMRPNTPAQAVS